MRILIGTTPLDGHINPLTAIALALMEAGHEVFWYTAGRYEKKISDIGARFFPFVHAPDVTVDDIDAQYPERANYQGIRRIQFDVRKLFLEAAEGQITDLVTICDTYHPDVFIGDSTFAGSVAAKYQFNIPVVIVNIAPLMLSSPNTAPFGTALLPSDTFFGRLRNRVLYWIVQHVILREGQREFNAILRKAGGPHFEGLPFDAIVRLPDLVLQTTTPLFEYPRTNLPDTLHFIGPIVPVFPKRYEKPDWWPELDANRPVVHVTQGTVQTDPERLILPAIRALGHQDLLVVVTTSHISVADLGTLPPNVRVEPFIPHGRLLPHVDVIITNGGYGAVQVALQHGIPIVAAGRAEDKAEVSARIEWAGVGVNLKTETPTASQIHHAVVEVLGNPSYRERAKRLRDDCAGYNASAQAVALIQHLVENTK